MSKATDVLIIGAGAAGLTLANSLPESVDVTVLAKAGLPQSSTFWAQGGIAAVLDDDDQFDYHIRDTLATGAGLSDPAAVRYCVESAPAVIHWLDQLGMPFTRDSDSGPYHLTKEGGHSHRRVIHSKDATGQALHQTLAEALQQQPNVTVLTHQIAIDLITEKRLTNTSGPDRCLGAYVLDTQTHQVNTYRAKVVVMATGGASKAYLYTSNPEGATGDGIAMAWRAGCRVSNMEFMQFHPTCLYHPDAGSFLITEAVRGEGGYLRLPDGSRFMQRFDDRLELAPRDIVARAIDYEMKRLGADCVYLDISHKPAAFIQQHFPTIYARALELGFDMTREALPVVPAAHYTCGGIVVDVIGQTDIPQLLALGEVACTGLHGANRIASNSLLECMVYAKAASEWIQQSIDELPAPPPCPDWDESQVTDSDEEVVVAHNWHELRLTLWNYVGIVRTDKRMHRAQRRVNMLIDEIDEYYRHFRVTSDLIELRNLAIVAKLIIDSALSRHESRGLHYTLDYPTIDPSLAQPTIMLP